MRHIEQVERELSGLLPGNVTQAQFDACVSLVYNIGIGAFKESTLLRKLMAGKRAAATAQFSRWNKINGKTSAGLADRRSAEAILFAGED
jgi:GH24 family phage-related lysozyme (muramidase)